MNGVDISQLPETVSNPYSPPRFGSDDPHQGVDLAQVDPVTQIALAGHTVHAVFFGRVAGVIEDRFPYGNAVLIETMLSQFGRSVASVLPTPGPTLSPHPALTCPELEIVKDWDRRERSLYILYAHMKNSPQVTLGQKITCGEKIGEIGQSGNALNPHIHIEARLGPAGIQIPSMAHYTSSATIEETGMYCLWRVSGWFQHLDPLGLIQAVVP